MRRYAPWKGHAPSNARLRLLLPPEPKGILPLATPRVFDPPLRLQTVFSNTQPDPCRHLALFLITEFGMLPFHPIYMRQNREVPHSKPLFLTQNLGRTSNSSRSNNFKTFLYRYIKRNNILAGNNNYPAS